MEPSVDGAGELDCFGVLRKPLVWHTANGEAPEEVVLASSNVKLSSEIASSMTSRAVPPSIASGCTGSGTRLLFRFFDVSQVVMLGGSKISPPIFPN